MSSAAAPVSWRQAVKELQDSGILSGGKGEFWETDHDEGYRHRWHDGALMFFADHQLEIWVGYDDPTFTFRLSDTTGAYEKLKEVLIDWDKYKLTIKKRK
jgi:hypothetical protein